jgi:hypothetical protein
VVEAGAESDLVAEVAAERQDAHASIRPRERAQHVERAVRAAVVDVDQLEGSERRQGRQEPAVQLRQDGLFVVDGKDDRDLGPRGGLGVQGAVLIVETADLAREPPPKSIGRAC